MRVENDGGMTEPSFEISEGHLLGGTFESPRFTKGGLWEVHRWSCKNAIWPYFLSKLPCWFVWELFSPQNCWWLNCLLGRKLACKFHEKNHRGDKRRDRQSTRETIPLSFPRSFPLSVRSNQQVHPDLYRNELHAMSTMAMIFFSRNAVALWWRSRMWILIRNGCTIGSSKCMIGKYYMIFFAYFGYINALFISFFWGGHPFSEPTHLPPSNFQAFLLTLKERSMARKVWSVDSLKVYLWIGSKDLLSLGVLLGFSVVGWSATWKRNP